MRGDDQGNALGDALRLAQAGIQTGIAAVRIPVPHGGNGGAQHLHRGGGMGKHAQNHDGFHRQAHGAGKAVKKGLKFGQPGQAAVPEQVGHLFEGGMLGQIDDVVAAVE